jgi:hypothetical protein
MTKHTPGPWYAHNILIGNNGKGPYSYPLGTSPNTAAANARLIAAAPDMLVTLQSFVVIAQHRWRSLPADTPEKVALNNARATIAKATQD